MPHTIFFSWQSDVPPKTGRNLIERALERAVGAVARDSVVVEAVRDGIEIDRDTKGVAGSPPIVETIFRKIDAAAVFVADLTFAGRRPDGAPVPNPNVLIEYGWALKTLGHGRIVAVMNTAFGDPAREQMPFDLAHLRHPIRYACPDDADDAARAEAREKLAKDLENAIRAVIDSDDFRRSLPKPPAPAAFPAKEPLDGPGRFRAKGKPLGVADGGFLGTRAYDVGLEPGPALWLRVMPKFDPGRRWSTNELRKAATGSGFLLTPINGGVGDYGYVRAEDGFGVYQTTGDRQNATSRVVFVFTTGEVWTVDSWILARARQHEPPFIPIDEGEFVKSVDGYTKFLSRLGLEASCRWIAGMQDLRGRGIFVPVPTGHFSPFPGPRGHCVVEHVVSDGLHALGSPAASSLAPFFTSLYNHCGIQRPSWLDEQGRSPCRIPDDAAGL